MITSVFLSLGQLSTPKLSKSFAAFAKQITLENPSYSENYAYFLVSYYFIKDKLWDGTINAYNNGKISTDDFRNQISSRLNINSYGFDYAWNAMCDFGDQEAQNIINFFQKQASDGFDAYIVSNTNPLQYNFLEEKISTLLQEHHLSLQNSHFFLSFEQQIISNIELAQTAIQQSSLDTADNQIISLHKDLSLDLLGINNAQFTTQKFEDFIGAQDVDCHAS